MAKLSALKPRLGGLSTRLGASPRSEQERDRQRASAQPWRQWYNTPRWRALRDRVRARDLYTCQRCKRICAGKGESAVDHKRPHRGDPVLFWDENNLRLLCKPCHDGAKQAEEAKDIMGVWY